MFVEKMRRNLHESRGFARQKQLQTCESSGFKGFTTATFYKRANSNEFVFKYKTSTTFLKLTTTLS